MITLTPEELANLIANAVATGVATALANAPTSGATASQSSNARRCKEYRERLKKGNTQDTGDHVATVSEHVEPCQKHVATVSNHVEACHEEIQPSPSSLPPVPPNPAPPPAIYASAKGASNEVEKSSIKPSKRTESAKALAELEAKQANEVKLPASLQTHMKLNEAWQAWCQWRTRLAITGKVGGKRHPWTIGAAERTIKQLLTTTPDHAISEIYRAIDHGWTGIHFATNDAQANYQPTRRPSPAGNRRSDTLNAPGRYSTPAEGSPTNGRRGNSALDQDMDFEL